MIRVSVVIPAYNAEETIKKCVSSVLKCEYKYFEVIVIDDKSIDNTINIVKNIKNKKLKLFINKYKSGASFSRNKGIKNSKGDIIILLDSDTYVKKDWIKKHINAHNKISADIIGGGIVGIYNTIFGKSDSYCSWWTSIPNSKSHYLKKLHLPTNNLSIKKEVFKKKLYFNEGLRIGGEDAEFCFKALKSGLKIYFKSNILAYHYDRDDFNSFLKHQEHWGKHAVKMRTRLRMNYSYLMPKSYIFAHFYVGPLAILFTVFVVSKWFFYDFLVIFYSPLIFIGKLKQTIALKNSFKK